MPKVSVIIPTCNRATYLRNALASVVGQTFGDFEIVVVDDASTDNTREVVSEFKGAPIKYLRHDCNRGGAVSRNTGISHSQSEYIAFLDDDDEWESAKLALQVSLLASSSAKVGAVYSAHDTINKMTGEIKYIWRPSRKGNIFEDLMQLNYVGTTSSVVLKRECLEKVGAFDDRLPCFQDYDLWIRMGKEYEFDYIDEILVHYYEHEKKIWTNYKAIENGIGLMVEKYGQSSKITRSFSYQYLGLGVRCIMDGDLKKGRSLLLKAIRLHPFEIKSYLNLALSFLGCEIFRKSHRLKRACENSRSKSMGIILSVC